MSARCGPIPTGPSAPRDDSASPASTRFAPDTDRPFHALRDVALGVDAWKRRSRLTAPDQWRLRNVAPPDGIITVVNSNSAQSQPGGSRCWRLASSPPVRTSPPLLSLLQSQNNWKASVLRVAPAGSGVSWLFCEGEPSSGVGVISARSSDRQRWRTRQLPIPERNHAGDQTEITISDDHHASVTYETLVGESRVDAWTGDGGATWSTRTTRRG